jgi:YHS domain-containing protein
MKIVMITVILAMVLALSATGPGWAAEPPMMEQPLAGKTQVACPVQHGKINKDLYVDYNGQRIYFCCKECIPIFQKDPEAYLKRMEREGVTPEKSPSGK